MWNFGKVFFAFWSRQCLVGRGNFRKLKSNFLIFDLLKLFTLYFYRILRKLLCFFLKVRRKSKLWDMHKHPQHVSRVIGLDWIYKGWFWVTIIQNQEVKQLLTKDDRTIYSQKWLWLFSLNCPIRQYFVKRWKLFSQKNTIEQRRRWEFCFRQNFFHHKHVSPPAPSFKQTDFLRQLLSPKFSQFCIKAVVFLRLPNTYELNFSHRVEYESSSMFRNMAWQWLSGYFV